MPKKSKLESQLPNIEEHLNILPQKAYTGPHLLGEFMAIQEQFELPPSQRFQKFVDTLLEKSNLSVITLESERYKDLTRFIWGRSSPFEIASTIYTNSYLTHQTAMFLHNLSDSPSKTIYVNHEQSPKSRKGLLSQEGIHRAFQQPQRRTNMIYRTGDYSIVVINGKNTGQTGTCSIPDPDSGYLLEVTNLERTLIDIVVRPSYAEGVKGVLNAYEIAKNKVNVENLVETLRILDYVYPYHQAIGFIMEKVGYADSQCLNLLNLGTEYEFYIEHALPATKEFDPKWKVYYPANLL